MQHLPSKPAGTRATHVAGTRRAHAARYLERGIFFALLALVVLTSIPYGTVTPDWEAFFHCSVFALGVLWVIEGLLAGSWRVAGLPLLLPLLALVAFAFLQTLPLWKSDEGGGWQAISADPFETRVAIFRLLALILTGELLLRYASNRRRLYMLVHVVIGVAVASALFGIGRQTMQGDAPTFLFLQLDPGIGYAQFINYNHFAFLMEMALGLILGLLAGGGVRRERWGVYLAMAAPIWLALALSTSRGGIVSILAQLVFIALLWGTAQPQQLSQSQSSGATGRMWQVGRSLAVRLVLAAGLVIVVAIGILWVGGNPLVSRFRAIQVSADGTEILEGWNEDGSGARENTSRMETWQATWRMIKDNPVAGVGLGGYWAAIAGYHDASGASTPQQAHNDYLELLASCGLVGIVLVAWFIYALVVRARRRLRAADSFRRAACFGALVGLFTVAVHSFVDFGLHVTINALVFTVLVVLATTEEGIGKRRLQKVGALNTA